MSTTTIDEIRAIDRSAADALEQFEVWEDADTADGRRMRERYGRRFVLDAATHPDLRHLVPDALLDEFRDVLETPYAIARGRYYDAVEHLESLKRRRGDGGQVSDVAWRAAEIDVEMQRAAERRAWWEHEATCLTDADRAMRDDYLRWADSDVRRLAAEAVDVGVPGHEIERATRGVLR